MKFRSIIFIIILYPTLLWSNNEYFFQDITSNYNVSDEAIRTICEDENGFVWFGGGNSLYYHNTINIEKVQLDKRAQKGAKSSTITKIYKDNQNQIWICTDKGLYKYLKSNNKFEHKTIYSGKKKECSNDPIKNIVQLDDQSYLIHKRNAIFRYNENDSTLIPINNIFKSKVTFLHKDINDVIFIGTSDGKVFESKDKLKQAKLLYHSSKSNISAICKDGNKYYIGHPRLGVDIINSNGIKIGELSSKHQGDNHLKDDHIRQIIKRKNGEIWIATYSGIAVLYNGKRTFIESQFETGLPHQTTYAMCTGSNNKVWVSTYGGGLSCYSDYNYIFNNIAINYSRKHFSTSHVSSICEDQRGYIWIGNEDKVGVKVFNPNTNDFIPEISNRLDKETKGIKTIIPIEDHLIAIGKSFSNKILLYNYKKNNIEKYIELPVKEDPGIVVIKLFGNKLWANDMLNVVSYDLSTQEIKNVFRSKSRVWQLFFDSSHNLWICTGKGLFIKKPGSDEVQALKSEQSDIDLSRASFYSVCEGKNGSIWIGTMGQGLYIYSQETGNIQPAPNHDLTAMADIYSLIKDKQNNIWYNTNQGLYRYDITNKRTDHYGMKDGISNTSTRPNSSYCSQTGKLYFGSKNGFNIIDPTYIKKNPIIPTVFLASFTINNQPYINDSNATVNTIGLTQLKKITLNDRQNTLGFKVVCNNYIKSEKNRFKYRLKNYSNNWVEASQNKELIFTKVPPGTYTFEAYGSNNDNIWSEHPCRLEITILPPYYKRWYAILLYIIVTITLIWYFYKELKTKIKLRKVIAEERYKAQAKELIHSERIALFTNISHELRTPLSLIISPLRYLLKKDIVDDQTRHLLNVADRNAKRLLKIADQSLDFRLLEIGKLKPNFKQHEIIQLTKDVYLCFEQQIIDRQINFSFTSEFQKLEISIDGDMVEKIIFNLLSNALKYTPEKGSIFLTISATKLSENDYENCIYSGNKFTGEAVSITVRDTGEGIKPELIPHIFERFTKGNNSHETSTGIGLHLCKEYSKMNKGNMLLTTEYGKGSSFILNLPLTEDALSETREPKQLAKYKLDEDKAIQQLDQKEDEHSFSILVAEDNGELRDFLKTFLGAYYKVVTVKSGEQALTVLEDFTPDLIITDVSMPGISGIELTKKIKEDQKLQLIPIIVMTGYIDRKYQMESILCGADAFFTKPIDEPMLLAQVKNVLEKIELRAQGKEAFNTIMTVEGFISKAEKIVEANLQNPEFEINDLHNALGISRTTLTRKLKVETQLNPSGFIREVRLKNATKLLRTNQFNIDEISDYVGFNSTSYFIRSFKTKYGVTPNEYKKEIQDQ